MATETGGPVTVSTFVSCTGVSCRIEFPDDLLPGAAEEFFHKIGARLTQAVGGAKVYYLNRRAEAAPGDVYYGSLSDGRAVLVTPSGEKTYPRPVCLVTRIDVDGRKVTGNIPTVTHWTSRCVPLRR